MDAGFNIQDITGILFSDNIQDSQLLYQKRSCRFNRITGYKTGFVNYIQNFILGNITFDESEKND